MFRKFSKVHTSVRSTSVSRYPAADYIFKVNNRNTRASCEVCSKLTIKAPKRHYCIYC